MKIVFLDRDGTVISEPLDERVESVEEVKLLPDTLKSLQKLAEHDYGIIFITNQAGIAEGKITEDEFWKVHNRLVDYLKISGVSVLQTYMNSEAATPDATDWRKPGPKMLLQAAEDFNLDLSEIYMIGDSESDIVAAKNAGCKGGVYLATERTVTDAPPAHAVYVAQSLTDAIEYIINN